MVLPGDSVFVCQLYINKPSSRNKITKYHTNRKHARAFYSIPSNLAVCFVSASATSSNKPNKVLLAGACNQDLSRRENLLRFLYYYLLQMLLYKAFTIILHIYCCQAEGKPDPEILWFKHDAPVIQSSSVKVVNDGTELRINRCCICYFY